MKINMITTVTTLGLTVALASCGGTKALDFDNPTQMADKVAAAGLKLNCEPETADPAGTGTRMVMCTDPAVSPGLESVVGFGTYPSGGKWKDDGRRTESMYVAPDDAGWMVVTMDRPKLSQVMKALTGNGDLPPYPAMQPTSSVDRPPMFDPARTITEQYWPDNFAAPKLAPLAASIPEPDPSKEMAERKPLTAQIERAKLKADADAAAAAKAAQDKAAADKAAADKAAKEAKSKKDYDEVARNEAAAKRGVQPLGLKCEQLRNKYYKTSGEAQAEWFASGCDTVSAPPAPKAAPKPEPTFSGPMPFPPGWNQARCDKLNINSDQWLRNCYRG